MDPNYGNNSNEITKSHRSWLWIAIVIPFLVVGIVVGILITTQIRSAKIDADMQTQIREVPTASGTALSEKIATSFIVPAQREDGSFVLTYDCNNTTANEPCIPQESQNFPQWESMAIIALQLVGESTNNQTLVERAQKSLERSLNLCLSGEDERYCSWQLFAFHEYFMRTQDERYVRAMELAQERLLADYPYATLVDNNIPITLQLLYEATGKEVYKDRLVTHADATLATPLHERKENNFIYFSADYPVRERSLQTIWAVYVPAYEATGDRKYLEAAREFFLQANIGQRARYLSIGGIAALLKGADALFTLAELDPEHASFYNQEGTAILANVIRDSLDSTENRKVNGDYALITSSNTKTTNLSAFLAILLQKHAPEHMFELLRSL